ncbi:MAG TPA: magnesium transporter [Myxococcota bacterium]|nr:magnesium transporter [Myxococcota bacterium]
MSDSRPLNARTEALFRRLVRREAEPALRKLLAMHRVEDVAAVMSHMTWSEQRRLYQLIEDRDAAAELLTLLPEDSVREITHEMTEEVVVDLIERMDPDDAVDVVGAMSDALRERVLAGLDDGHEVQELLAWAPDTAGGIMSSACFTMPDTATCGAAIRELQRVHESLTDVHYAYVVDRDRRLVGVTSLRGLVVRPPNTPLVQIMTRNPIAVRPEVDQEEVAGFFARYDLMAIPVVDGEHRILGIVTVDDVVDVIREEAEEDMYRMAGMSEPDPVGSGTLGQAVRQRAGWLLATLVGGLCGSELIASYQSTLAQVAALAGFIPLVMGMGGNVGLQSATVAVRGLATGQVDLSGAFGFVLREGRTGFALGLIYGSLLTMFGVLRFADIPLVGLAVGTAVLCSMTGASLLGAGIPVALSRAGADPAIATGPLVTTCIDLLGVFVYFNVARLLLGL